MGGFHSSDREHKLGTTATLAAWVAGSELGSIPRGVTEHTRLLILDALGCGLLGAREEWSRITAGFAGAAGGRGEATIWGTRQRVAGALAPFANGTAVHALEYDDLHPAAVVHAGAQVIPVAFAIAEMRAFQSAHSTPETRDVSIPAEPVTAEELLHAIVIGFEIAARIGLATGAGQLARGFHPSPNTATFAAAATASRLLHLDAGKTAHALGIAGSFGGYLMAAQFGAMVKRVHAGHSGQSGVTSALLAARGLTGTASVLEAPYGGFAATYSDTLAPGLAEVCCGLGEHWETENFSIKYYPCCGSNHTSIDAWWAVQTREGLTSEDIEDVEVRCSTLTLEHVGWAYIPGSVTTAQMNLSYCLAVAMTDGELALDQFDPSRLADPHILDIVDRIRVRADSSIDSLGSDRRHLIRLTVRTKDGQTYEESCEFPRGSAGNPLTRDDVLKKFRTLAGSVLSAPQVSQIERQILFLGSPSGGDGFDIGALSDLLVPETALT
ncbi:2-methylcitrate dehydratase PrpD [Cryobacterium flavum]|uniref:2-methylcitrate dehydratase PrpD n=1 Tax=Cryobacterium flavum TaxID=1424659 RepID=A0A4R8VJM8_9MICO|nr:MmgE/PrpD family protein [Cryobacterium flavum]TFB82309.1 MmgE/PrpD family protein [Cryobacterium flavum]SDN96613.1 2-methylcitrate dehydratase PrpD [Cryobacterium flavum]